MSDIVIFEAEDQQVEVRLGGGGDSLADSEADGGVIFHDTGKCADASEKYLQRRGVRGEVNY